MVEFFLVLLFSAHTVPAKDTVQTELDLMWDNMSKAVARGDIKAYRSMFHQDAVLVKGDTGSSYHIDKAFARWKQGFEDTKSGKIEANVTFRFSQRIHDKNTAHETGMYHYYSIDETGERKDYYVDLEALLVKKNDEWLVIMEFQKSSSTKAQWDLLN